MKNKSKKIIIMFLAIICVICIQINSYAHKGRTDSSGGHKDKENDSGLGSYHYHCGGNPAHLHTNGVCPYSSSTKSSSSSSKTTTVQTSLTTEKTTEEIPEEISENSAPIIENKTTENVAAFNTVKTSTSIIKNNNNNNIDNENKEEESNPIGTVIVLGAIGTGGYFGYKKYKESKK